MNQHNITIEKESTVEKIRRYMPRLFAIWLLLSVLGPHQDMYKVFFHAVVIPAILVLLISGQARINWRDPLLVTALILAVYASLATFVVGEGPFTDHFRKFRWGVETFFCLMAFYLWLPHVLKNPRRWGPFFMLLALLGAWGGLGLYCAGLIEDRMTGLGALHNAIQGASILIIYLAAGYYLSFLRSDADYRSRDLWLMMTATVFVCVFVLMSQSRAPIFALAVFMIFPAVHLLSRLNFLAGGAILFGGAGLIGGVIALVYGLEHYKKLLLLRGWSFRLEIWKGYLTYPPDSWWFGLGAGTDPARLQAAKELWEPAGTPISHAHNLWLGTLVETGLIGLFLLCVIAGLLFKSSLTISNDNAYRRSGRLMLLLLVFLLTLTGSHTLISSIKAIWLIGWLPLLIVWFSQFNEKNNQ